MQHQLLPAADDTASKISMLCAESQINATQIMQLCHDNAGDDACNLQCLSIAQAYLHISVLTGFYFRPRLACNSSNSNSSSSSSII
jgi:hypothetical protein